MLVIRLARGGRSKYPVYRIVAAESSRAATSKFVEILGTYNPHTKELAIKKDETENRLKHGAQPSNSVIKLLQRENIELPGWVKLKTKSKKPKNEPEVKEEAPVAAAPSDEPAAEELVADNEVTPEEAAAEADETTEVVAQAATDNAAEVADNAEPAGKTETAEDTEAAAEAAIDASEAAAESATPEAADKPA